MLHFLRFAAAFPSADQLNLFEVCENVGFSGDLLTIVETLYQDAQMLHEVDGVLHRLFTQFSGIAQGCPLSEGPPEGSRGSMYHMGPLLMISPWCRQLSELISQDS